MSQPAGNLANNLAESARRYPDRPALREAGLVLTFAELDDAAARVAGLLEQRGIGVGDRVGIMLPNVVPFALVYYGVLWRGAVVVPMNPLLKAREVAFYLGDAGAKLIFAWRQFADEAAKGAAEAGAEVVVVDPGEIDALLAADPRPEVVARDPGDTAVILYTSGTTGKPKGAELTHANLLVNAAVFRTRLIAASPDDVILGALPLFHSFGQTCGLNSAIASGACLSLLPRFDPAKALEIIERDRVTIFEGVPTMFTAMLHVPDRGRYDISSLRVCVSGGAALPVEVLRGFDAAFDCKVLEGYGLSETSPVASFNHPDRERKPGSIGTPIDGVEMRVVDGERREVPHGEVGEIAIRGHNVMKGYWRRPDSTAEVLQDGWFHTGDMARQDEDGYFFIVDRKKDMIIRGGYNVYPREVEEVFYEHPAVQEVAVIGVPHPEYGEEVAAAVVVRAGHQVSVGELRDHVKSQVAAYKYPRHIWFVDALPKGPTGKILKREISLPAELSR